MFLVDPGSCSRATIMKWVGRGATRQDTCEDNDLRCVRPLIQQTGRHKQTNTHSETNAQRHPLDILKLCCLQLSILQTYNFFLDNAFSHVNAKRLINSLLLYNAVFLPAVIILPLLINIA